jgi:hypothetical protein
MCSEVADAIGHRYDHEVVFHNVVTFLVEHEAPLPCHAKEMHAAVAQLTRVHRIEVGGILEIGLHH